MGRGKTKGGMDGETFVRSVKNGPLRAVYAFVGENSYMAHKCSEALRDRFVSEGAGSAVKVFVGDEPAEVIFDELRTADLFVSKRLVIVLRGEVFIRANMDALVFYLEHPSAGSVLAVVCEKLDARTRLAKLIGSVGQMVRCKKLYPDQVVGWVRARFREAGKTSDAGVAEMLVEELGEDLFALESEVRKLSDYVGQRKRIELKDVRSLVGHDHHWEVFALTDAVGRGDTKRALGVLVDLMSEGEAPERLVAQLAWQLRRLWTARRLLDEGRSDAEVGREVRVHPRFLRGFMAQTARFSQAGLARLYRALAETDLALKTGRLDRSLAVERFVVEACRPETEAVAGRG